MDESKLNSMAASNLLARVADGTEVYDSTGEHIGKVDAIYLGAAADGDRGEAAPATTSGVPADALDADVKIFSGLFFTKSDIPKEVRERLRYNGFIRIAPHGLFRSHRYAMREQVVAVGGDRVTLSVPESELLKS